jgi:RHS repeat-associated protein
VADPVLSVPPEVPLKPGQRILWTGNYESFGRPDNNVPVCPGAFDNPIQFTGYYNDGDVFEHYYAKARYYDPYTGRFLSRDPADFEYDDTPLSVNRYLYCGNNPLINIDPNGRFFFSLFMGFPGVLLDMLSGGFLGIVGSWMHPDVNWGQGLITGLISGLFTGAMSGVMSELVGIPALIAGEAGMTWDMFEAFAIGSMFAAQQTYLTMRYPGAAFNTEPEGPFPLYAHHGAWGYIASIVGMGINKVLPIFSSLPGFGENPWPYLAHGGGWALRAGGAVLMMDDFWQHFLVQLWPGPEDYKSPINEWYQRW